MFQLIRLLLAERWRKTQVQQAWVAQLSAGIVLLVFAGIFTTFLIRLLNGVSSAQIGLGLNSFLASWIILGVFTGKDFTWHVRLDRLIFFPLSFQRLYALTFILGFLSFPLLLGLSVLEISFWRKNPLSTGWVTTLLGFCLLICIVRLTVSLVRTGLYQTSALSKSIRYLSWGILASIVTLVIMTILRFGIAELLSQYLFVGYQFVLVLLGINPWRHLLL
ncbi:MAG: hypothetical protein ACRD63_16960, partial [Pyrinomonadaceae bacterium]